MPVTDKKYTEKMSELKTVIQELSNAAAQLYAEKEMQEKEFHTLKQQYESKIFKLETQLKEEQEKFAIEKSNFKAETLSYKQDVAAFRQLAETLKEEKDRYKKKKEDLQKRDEENKQKQEENLRKAAELIAQEEQFQTDRNALNEKISELENTLKQVREYNRKLKQDLSQEKTSQNAQSAELKNQIKELKEQNEKLSATQKQASEIHTEELQKQIATLTAQKSEQQELLNQQTTVQESLRKQVEELTAQNAQLAEKIQQQSASADEQEVLELKAQIATLTKERNMLHNKLDYLYTASLKDTEQAQKAAEDGRERAGAQSRPARKE